MGLKPHLFKTAEILIARVRCMISWSSELTFLYLYMCSLVVKYVYRRCMYFCKYMSLRNRWLIKHPSVPGRASADLLRAFWKLVALFKHQTMPGWSPLKSYNLHVKQNPPCPYDVCKRRTVPGRYPFTLNDPTKRRTAAVKYYILL